MATTSKDRLTKHREARAREGWRLVQANLSPAAAKALAKLQKTGGTLSETISAALIKEVSRRRPS